MDDPASPAPAATATDTAPPIRIASLWWVAAAVAFMIIAIASGDHWFLNFVHVMFGLMWTGIDLFMGFVLGPILRRITLAARRQVIVRLVPKTLFMMPTLSAVTITSGWYLAQAGGYLDLPAPAVWWVYAALAISGTLTVQGVGALLPINIVIYLQLRRDAPDPSRIDRLMKFYLWIVASQGIQQLMMIVIMARLVTGV